MSLHLNHAYQIHSPISGLVCTGDFSGGLNGRKRPEMVRVICNPRTRQSFTLPRMNTRKGCEVRSFFGYDPVEKQFKVLSMTLSHGKDDATHQVSDARNWETFMEKDRMWRTSLSWIWTFCMHQWCFVLQSYTPNMSSSSDDVMITCFDVRSEKFMSFIKVTETFSGKATLINYKGTLASLAPKGS